MPNVSELQRMTEELEDLKDRFKGCMSKVGCEDYLRRIRDLEKKLGIESKPYNGGM